MTRGRHLLMIFAVCGAIVLLVLKWTLQLSFPWIFTGLLGFILLNHGLDELALYKETKNKLHLLVPVVFLAALALSLAARLAGL